MSKKTLELNINYGQPRRSYGCLGFLGDAFMLVITCGLWFFWILIRDTRR
jgi:hypothetical protein